MEVPELSVSQFVDICNQTLTAAYQDIIVVGEVSSFKVSQNKWAFFDLKDEDTSVNCFMPLAWLNIPLEDGIKVKVKATPKLTKWGKFSLTVRQIMPVGAGSIKKSFDLLKAKLAKEGLFSPDRKRPLPSPLSSIGVISSTQAAGYADFIKIINERWGGLNIQVAHTMVQGLSAPAQIIKAINHFNQSQTLQVIAILRGGGSADDLAAFNDEALVRAIAASRLPVITGIGHEIDESLSDLAADFAASTPSNAAQILTPDRQAETRRIHSLIISLTRQIISQLDLQKNQLSNLIQTTQHQLIQQIDSRQQKLAGQLSLLKTLDPESVLARGYAIIKGQIEEGSQITVTTAEQLIKAEVKNVKNRQK